MENDNIILNVDSDNRRIKLSIFKESTIIDIISELLDKRDVIKENILQIFNSENNNYEVNLVYIEISGRDFNESEKKLFQKTLKVGLENLLSNIIIEFEDDVESISPSSSNVNSLQYINSKLIPSLFQKYS